MRNEEIESVCEIANLHEQRIQSALDKISYLFPLDQQKVTNLTENDLFAIEMLTSRFSKLQDYLGNTVFDLFFDIEGENTETWTPIDKINRLEKYKIIDDAHVWRAMRKARNFLTHEYPNQPDIIAQSLNRIYSFVPQLLEVKSRLLTQINKDN